MQAVSPLFRDVILVACHQLRREALLWDPWGKALVLGGVRKTFSKVVGKTVKVQRCSLVSVKAVRFPQTLGPLGNARSFDLLGNAKKAEGRSFDFLGQKSSARGEASFSFRFEVGDFLWCALLMEMLVRKNQRRGGPGFEAC